MRICAGRTDMGGSTSALAFQIFQAHSYVHWLRMGLLSLVRGRQLRWRPARMRVGYVGMIYEEEDTGPLQTASGKR